MQTLDDPPHFKIWPYLSSFSFLFLKIFPRCYIPIFDGLVFINVALKCGNFLFKQREVRIHLAPSILLDSLIHIDVLDDPSKNSFLDSLKKQFSNNLYLSKQITTTNKHYPSHQGFISKYIKVARPNSREGGFKVLFDILLGNSLIVTDGESWWSQF